VPLEQDMACKNKIVLLVFLKDYYDVTIIFVIIVYLLKGKYEMLKCKYDSDDDQ